MCYLASIRGKHNPEKRKRSPSTQCDQVVATIFSIPRRLSPTIYKRKCAQGLAWPGCRLPYEWQEVIKRLIRKQFVDHCSTHLYCSVVCFGRAPAQDEQILSAGNPPSAGEMAALQPLPPAPPVSINWRQSNRFVYSYRAGTALGDQRPSGIGHHQG